MPAPVSIPEAVVEVIEPDGARRVEKISTAPFLIGRGAEEGNHLQVSDKRVSRRSAAFTLVDGAFHLVDRGQRQGLFVNGEKVENSRQLREGDLITLGAADTLQLIFHLGESHDSLPELLSRMEGLSTLEPGARDLRQLSLLLEATTLLQSGLPIEDLLGAMVDRAISITDADRGLLMEPEAGLAGGKFRPLVARQRGGVSMASSAVAPSQTVIHHAL
jgi:predicted component of type VI protein secretion system